MPADLKLSARREGLLRSQVFDETQPGSVLHDFGAVLEFLGTEGVAAQGKYNLLPIAAIPDLDERLARPLRLDLKRPQLRSHPYLQGLHLLLRASGLTRVAKVKSETRLMPDSVVVEQWRRLNPTEQYFTLLGAWLLNGRAEMVGERSGNFPDMLGDCVATWQHLPQKGKRFRVDDRYGAWLQPIGRAFYQLALMDLFGLLAVERPTVPVKALEPRRRSTHAVRRRAAAAASTEVSVGVVVRHRGTRGVRGSR